MARLVAGGFSFQRPDDPARVTVSILARELDTSPRAIGSMTHIDTSNRNYGIHVDCLRISDDDTRIFFSGQVDMTTNPTFKDRWLLAMWENVGGQWYLMGNWTDGERALAVMDHYRRRHASRLKWGRSRSFRFRLVGAGS